MLLLIIALVVAIGTVDIVADGAPAPVLTWPATAGQPWSPSLPTWAPAGEYVDRSGRFAIVPPAGWQALDDPTRASLVQFAEVAPENLGNPPILEIDAMDDLSPDPVPVASRADVLARYAAIKVEHEFAGAPSATSSPLPEVAADAPARLISVQLTDRTLQILIAFDPNGLDCYQLRAERPHTANAALDPVLLASLRTFRVLH